MDLERFIQQRPYLYHLTNAQNAESILAEKKLYSANQIIYMSGDHSDNVNRQRRVGHQEIKVGEKSYFLRDQRPISQKALEKCLTDGWKMPDFLYYLNDRVFMWPTLDRLRRHYNRYALENPVIFRFPTRETIEANPHVKFCRLNSGATRANSYLGGKPPERGKNSFLSAENFLLPLREVAEVTFENECNFDFAIARGLTPDGVFVEVIPKGF
ncbi:hypothetical protein EA772_01910 [Pedobacter sp. G11]|uniref:DUF7002 family protein n=1 Tax=Pedobacter sp. G11 TaxID=2482728 RepID=UPI000F5FB67C|nr:hypothetical protein [Pedobacter sp. G11]AZI24160.1 hypothetical protein EA772_01910 [Pedobacter sp. G11]